MKFGIWERLKGKVVVGLDENDVYFNEIGKEIGETEHILTIDEIPSHGHTYAVGTNMTTEANYTNAMSAYPGGNPRAINTSGSGGGQAHNNIQPTKVVGYMWIRRS